VFGYAGRDTEGVTVVRQGTANKKVRELFGELFEENVKPDARQPARR